MIELLLEAESALSLGMLDRAELLYRQVAGADPRNSIAVVGLARVMLERGDELTALKLARRALTIDPENDAAQRMTQRLEEVLRYRGADVPATPDGVLAPAASPTAAPAVPTHPAQGTSFPGAPAVTAGAEHATPAPGPLETRPQVQPSEAPEPPTARPGPVARPDTPPQVKRPPPRSLVDRLLRRR
jgi:tetratricopeptide (TPR) repeat protein